MLSAFFGWRIIMEKNEQAKRKGYIEYEMEDGEKIEMSLTFAQIMKLRSEDKELYDKVNKVLTKGPEDVMEIPTVLYAAYLCACNDEKKYTYRGFIENMNQGYEYNMESVKGLIAPSKKRRSGKYF